MNKQILYGAPPHWLLPLQLLQPMPMQMPSVSDFPPCTGGLAIGAEDAWALGAVRSLASAIEPHWPPQVLDRLLTRAHLSFCVAREAPIGPMKDGPVTIPVEATDYVAIVDALDIVRRSGVLKTGSPLSSHHVRQLRELLRDMCRVVGRDVDKEYPDETVRA